MGAIYEPWNHGVWNHQWQLAKATCLLCGSTGPCIVVGSQAVCAHCLTEFPNVPWHPTGSVRPDFQRLVQHVGDNHCPQHPS